MGMNLSKNASQAAELCPHSIILIFIKLSDLWPKNEFYRTRYKNQF